MSAERFKQKDMVWELAIDQVNLDLKSITSAFPVSSEKSRLVFLHTNYLDELTRQLESANSSSLPDGERDSYLSFARDDIEPKLLIIEGLLDLEDEKSKTQGDVYLQRGNERAGQTRGKLGS